MSASSGARTHRLISFQEGAGVEILEAPDSDFGLFLWPAGEVLAWFLWQHPEVRGCSFLFWQL